MFEAFCNSQTAAGLARRCTSGRSDHSNCGRLSCSPTISGHPPQSKMTKVTPIALFSTLNPSLQLDLDSVHQHWSCGVGRTKSMCFTAFLHLYCINKSTGIYHIFSVSKDYAVCWPLLEHVDICKHTLDNGVFSHSIMYIHISKLANTESVFFCPYCDCKTCQVFTLYILSME